jgi:hypothetical protein
MDTRHQRWLQSKFLKWGFTGVEAEQFGNQFSSEAINECAYLRKMILDRRMITLNAKQYGWSTDKCIRYIRKQYIDKGFLKPGRKLTDKIVWKLFKWYKDNQVPQTGQLYDTPRSKMKKKDYIEQPMSEKRKNALQADIDLLNRNIANIKDEGTIKLYTRQRDDLQRQLDNLE